MPRGLVRAAAVGLAIALWGPVASALAVGYPDHSYGTVANSLTASKPESKLWFNDGWWATMAAPGTGAQHIFRLDRSTEHWIDTGTAVDRRAAAHTDVLWDGADDELYVASHAFTETGGTAGGPGKLYRFTYDPSSRTYSRDKGFPVTLSPLPTETLVIARDSTGTLWATWTLDSRVWVSHTTGGNDKNWISPYVVPIAGADVAPDDISSIVAFGGNQVGLMWSNHADGRFYFATHLDGGGDTAFDWSGGPIPGTPPTDDHINLKADSAGRIYAAVKFTTTAPGDPLLALLVRDPTLGTWEQHTIGTVADSQTRPIVLLDEERQLIHVFYTGPEPPSPTGQNGGTIYEKTSPMNGISFPPGDGTPVIRDAANPSLNDVTSTKQGITTASGMIVLANNPTTNVYWHTDIRLDGSTPPPPPPPPPPPAPPAGTLSFTATADAFVRSTFANLNYGDWSSLRVRNGADGSDTYRSYLRFTVTGLTGSVTSAVLNLKSATRNADGGTVYAVSAPWDESAVTWSNSPPLGTVVGQVAATTPGQVQVPLAASAITGNGTYSFAIAGGESGSSVYSSREGDQAPRLFLTQGPPLPPPPPAPPSPPPSPPPPPHPHGRLTAAMARQKAARMLLRRFGHRWRSGHGRRIRCRARSHGRSYVCRVWWRYRHLRVGGVVIVVATGDRATATHAHVRFAP